MTDLKKLLEQLRDPDSDAQQRVEQVLAQIRQRVGVHQCGTVIPLDQIPDAFAISDIIVARIQDYARCEQEVRQGRGSQDRSQ